MTIENIPLAIDGALTDASLFRKGLWAGLGRGGVIGETSFAVSASSPAGQSLRVGPGLAAVPNGYQTNPDEAYIVSNPATHNVPSGDMPGSSGSTTYWMVCLVVGDPNGYDQTGHPFMPSDFDEDQANTFEYNRIVLFACNVGDTSFDDLGKAFPGLALARIALPASTTTVTSGMITNLRSVIRSSVETEWTSLSVTGHMTGTIKYKRTNDGTVFIEMAGSKTAGGGVALGTLPVGFRPAIQHVRLLNGAGLLTSVYVTSDGVIHSDFGTGAYGGFSFPAA